VTLLADEVVVATPVPFWTRTRLAGAGYAGLGLLAAVLLGALTPGDVTNRFVISETTQGPGWEIGGRFGAILFAAVAVAAGAALLVGVAGRLRTWAHTVAVVGLLMSFLNWQMALARTSHAMPVEDIADGTLRFALPLIFGALAGVLCERAGVINVAIEGQFIMGAFSAALFATVAASVWVGLIAAGIAGALVGALLAVLAIRYLMNQVVLGVMLVALGIGLTGFLYERTMQIDSTATNEPGTLPVWTVPYLSDLPVVGPMLFKANILVYLALVLVLLVHIGLFHTRWGLRVRAVGEHPTAADTLGVRVRLVRYRNVILAGMVAGIGGAFFILDSGNQFGKEISAGKGFIALAALIVGRWNPLGALLAALFFGFAEKLQLFLSGIGSPIPSQFLSMTPYLATIVAVAGLVGRVRAPAADGLPYVKG